MLKPLPWALRPANVGISFPLSRKKSVARLLYDMNVYLIAECLFIFGKIFDYMFHIYQLFNMSMPGVLHKGKISENPLISIPRPDPAFASTSIKASKQPSKQTNSAAQASARDAPRTQFGLSASLMPGLSQVLGL